MAYGSRSTRVVYLDVDGTIIPQIGRGVPEAAMIARLTRLLETTGAQVVVSSDRRLTLMSDEIYGLLEEFGIGAGQYHSDRETPFDIDIVDGIPVRAQEIAAHVRTNGVERYVILDDAPMAPAQRPFHVRPADATVGLTDEDIDQAIAILTD